MHLNSLLIGSLVLKPRTALWSGERKEGKQARKCHENIPASEGALNSRTPSYCGATAHFSAWPSGRKAEQVLPGLLLPSVLQEGAIAWSDELGCPGNRGSFLVRGAGMVPAVSVWVTKPCPDTDLRLQPRAATIAFRMLYRRLFREHPVGSTASRMFLLAPASLQQRK